MENLEEDIEEISLWEIKMTKVANKLISENVIKDYNKLEGDIRIRYNQKLILTITYSQSRDIFYIHLKDYFYIGNENRLILNMIVKNIKGIYQEQNIVVF